MPSPCCADSCARFQSPLASTIRGVRACVRLAARSPLAIAEIRLGSCFSTSLLTTAVKLVVQANFTEPMRCRKWRAADSALRLRKNRLSLDRIVVSNVYATSIFRSGICVCILEYHSGGSLWVSKSHRQSSGNVRPGVDVNNIWRLLRETAADNVETTPDRFTFWADHRPLGSGTDRSFRFPTSICNIPHYLDTSSHDIVHWL